MLEQIGSSSNSSLSKNLGCAFFLLVLLGSIGVGIYLVVLAERDEFDTEVEELDLVIENWTNVTLPVFSSFNITAISANGTFHEMNQQSTSDWTAISDELDPYSTLIYHVGAPMFTDSSLSKHVMKEDPVEYERKSDLTFVIENGPWENTIEDIVVMSKKRYNLNQKMCRIHRTGCWDPDTHACYYHYNLVTLCVVVNETSGMLVDWYPKGCNDAHMESYEYFKWENCTVEPTYAEGNIDFQIRSVNDPFIYSEQNSLESLSAKPRTLLVGGIILIVVAFVLLAIPAIFFCKKPRSTLLYQSNFEMERRI